MGLAGIKPMTRSPFMKRKIIDGCKYHQTREAHQIDTPGGLPISEAIA
jgi:hypothetical protein